MRACRNGWTHETSVQEIFDTDLSTAVGHAQDFVELGLLTSMKANGEYWFETTTRGNAISNATFSKAIKRATAETNLQFVVERASEYNANPDFILTVKKLIVFGSYLRSDVKELSDIDIGIVIVERTSSDDFVAAVRKYAAESNRNFKSFLDELFWPSVELRQILKGKKPSVSLTTEDVAQLTDQWSVVYDVTADTKAIQPPFNARSVS